jgi:hypothetical protein
MLRVRADIVRRLMQQLKTELKDVQRIGVPETGSWRSSQMIA